MSNVNYQITAAAGIHRGDQPYQQDQVSLICHPHIKDCMIAVLADGDGGPIGGLKAAEQVILTAQQLLEHYLPLTQSPTSLLGQLVQEAHTAIKFGAIASEQPPYSTIAACLINPDGSCHWTHVGNSRIYHFSGQEMVSCTIDHSYAQSMQRPENDNGEVLNFENKSGTLTACLGGSAEPPVEATSLDRLEPGDSLIICSDGLWQHFNDSELGDALLAPSTRQITEILIDKARFRTKENGDNLSLIIIKAH